MATERPKLFLLKMLGDSGYYYAVCESLVEVDENELPGEVGPAIKAVFDAEARKGGIHAAPLPSPGGDTTRSCLSAVMMQAMRWPP